MVWVCVQLKVLSLSAVRNTERQIDFNARAWYCNAFLSWFAVCTENPHGDVALLVG